MSRMSWTKEEDDFLIENYPLLGAKKCAEELNQMNGTSHTRSAVNCHVRNLRKNRKLEIESPDPPMEQWTDEEVEFLVNNYEKFGSHKMCEELYKNFGIRRTVGSVQAKTYKLRKKGVRCSIQIGNRAPESSNPAYLWTSEHIDFLKSYYPNHGVKETAKELYIRFGIKRSEQSVRRIVREQHINMNKLGRKELAKRTSGRNMAIGSIATWKNSNSRLLYYIKVANNGDRDDWMPLTHYLLGEEANDKMVIHLNGNHNDFRKEKLAVISKSVCARLSTKHLLSEDPELTKTGIMLCELMQALKDQEKGDPENGRASS